MNTKYGIFYCSAVLKSYDTRNRWFLTSSSLHGNALPLTGSAGKSSTINNKIAADINVNCGIPVAMSSACMG
jgi:hypothetical protein